MLFVVIGFIPEGRAERALQGVQKVLSHQARVTRHGRKRQIPAEEVVPGDIVLLDTGDRVPADLRLIEALRDSSCIVAMTGDGVVARAARTLAVNALVTGQSFYLLDPRSFRDTLLTLAGLAGNPIVPFAIGALLVLLLIIVYTPVMNALSGAEPLGLLDGIFCLAVGGGVFLVVEIEKALMRRGVHPFPVHIAAEP